MPTNTPILTNFTAGEFSPELDGRVDISRYFNAVKTMENFLIRPYGGATRRPGSTFVAEVKDSSKLTELIPFQFSTEDQYVIEVGEDYMRFHRNQASVLESAKTITGATQANPVVITSTAHGFSNGDEVYITGISGMTELNGKRYLVANKNPNDFELTDKDGANIDGTAFTAYSSGGTVARVYEISSPYQEADLREIQFAQTADIMYLAHKDYAPRKLSRTGHTSWTLAEVDFVKGPVQDDNATATTITPSADTGTGITLTASTSIFDSGHVGSIWRIKDGYVEIKTYSSGTSVTADVLYSGNLNTGPGAVTDWAEAAWSDYRGWPSCVNFFEQRSVWAATDTFPQTVWLSESQALEDMLKGATDDDALIYEIASEQVNRIRWINPGVSLVLGTAGGVWLMDGGGQNDPLTPTNVRVRRETTYGSKLLQPKRIGFFVYYVQRNERTLREFVSNLEIDRPNVEEGNMTLLAEHITDSKIVEMDYQQSPDNTLWCVRTDGEIAVLTRHIDEQVQGWSRQILGGSFSSGQAVVESIAIIPQGEYDEVWISVKRTINSVTRRYVEYISAPTFDALEDAFFVDSGLTYDGAAATTITGLDHLEGETVQVLADGAVVADKTVSNGQITIDNAASKVHVGLGYTSKIESLRMEGGSATGTAQGKIQRIYKAGVRFYRTLGAKFGTSEKQDTIIFRKASDPMDSPPPLYSGDKEIQFPKGYTKEPRLLLTQEQPLPMTVLALLPKLEVFDS